MLDEYALNAITEKSEMNVLKAYLKGVPNLSIWNKKLNGHK